MQPPSVEAESDRFSEFQARRTEQSALLRSLMVCARFSVLYPPGHHRVTAQMALVCEGLKKLFADFPEQLEFSVTGHQLLVGDLLLDDANEVGQTFAALLRHRQIQSVVLHPDIGEEEIGLLIEILSTNHRDLLQAGGPKTLLARRQHEHLELRFFESLGTGPFVAPARTADETDAGEPRKEGQEGKDQEEGPLRGLAEELAGDESADQGAGDVERGTGEGRGDGSSESFRAGSSVNDPDLLLAGGLVAEGGDAAPELAGVLSPQEQHLLERVLGEEPEEEEEAEEEPEDDAEQESDIVDEAVAFPVDDDLVGDAAIQELLAEGVDELQDRIAGHAPDVNALRILFRFLIFALDEQHYQQRRGFLVDAVRDGRYLTPELVIIMQRLLDDGTLWRFERGDDLVPALIEQIDDSAVIREVVTTLRLRAEVAKRVLTQVATRDDALPLVARLLCSRLPKVTAEVLPDIFIELAHRDRGAFLEWAHDNSKLILNIRLLRLLMEHGDDLFAPICQRVLDQAPAWERERLIRILCSDGGEESLRILVTAARWPGRKNRDVLEALGRFPHRLAFETLREVIERNNSGELDLAEAETAIYSVHALALDESRDYLWKIYESRKGRFSYEYKRPLRVIAEALLEEYLDRL